MPIFVTIKSQQLVVSESLITMVTTCLSLHIKLCLLLMFKFLKTISLLLCVLRDFSVLFPEIKIGSNRIESTTGKQWNQLSANFKDVKLRLKNHVMLPTRPDKGWRHALLHPWKVKFLSINGLLTIKRQRRENNRTTAMKAFKK